MRSGIGSCWFFRFSKYSGGLSVWSESAVLSDHSSSVRIEVCTQSPEFRSYRPTVLLPWTVYPIMFTVLTVSSIAVGVSEFWHGGSRLGQIWELPTWSALSSGPKLPRENPSVATYVQISVLTNCEVNGDIHQTHASCHAHFEKIWCFGLRLCAGVKLHWEMVLTARTSWPYRCTRRDS